MAAEFTDLSADSSKRGSVNPRVSLYKKPIKKDNYRLEVDNYDTPQEIRRQRLLFYQKKSRDALFNAGRTILEEVLNSDEENEEMEVDKQRRTIKRSHYYANQLMMSEWMFEVPQDYLEKWVMVPCPVGRRSFVIACKGETKAYNRRGMRLGRFKSALPGGNSNEHKSSCTILDCIWIKEMKMYFVLDILAWSNQPLLNCDTEFRFFWLKSQLNEIQELKEQNTLRNTYPIIPLPNTSCDSNIYEFLTSLSTLPPLDGLLFYHREGHYTKGRTPLVTWLKPFMLPEVLGVLVPPPFDEKPEGYIDFKHYVLSNSSKGKRKTSVDSNMETADVE
ncbi:snurportin-1 [Cephus cinctus]|uniref:Snurportin-1 n=1 Tax=Cephus cinctus TaxID=211228 RepID=A0AAJ7BUC6_CEPCN|nr:snurportin-1 [Cephus cinctus]